MTIPDLTGLASSPGQGGVQVVAGRWGPKPPGSSPTLAAPQQPGQAVSPRAPCRPSMFGQLQVPELARDLAGRHVNWPFCRPAEEITSIGEG